MVMLLFTKVEYIYKIKYWVILKFKKSSAFFMLLSTLCYTKHLLIGKKNINPAFDEIALEAM